MGALKKIGITELEAIALNVKRGEMKSADLRDALRRYAGVSIVGVAGRGNEYYNDAIRYTALTKKHVAGVMENIKSILVERNDEYLAKFQDFFKIHNDAYIDEYDASYSPKYIKKVSARDLEKLAEGDGDHFELLQAMRNYVGASIADVTGSEQSTSGYIDFYRLNPPSTQNEGKINRAAYIKSSLFNLFDIVGRLEEIAESKPLLDMDTFNAARDSVYKKYARGYEENNKTWQIRIRQRQVGKARLESKVQESEGLDDIDNYFDLLKGLREHFELSGEEVGEILNSKGGITNLRVYQYENKNNHAKNILPEEYLENLLNDYRERAGGDEEISKALVRLKNLWREEYVNHGPQIAKKVKVFADKKSTNLTEYLTYLVIEAGYSPGAIGFDGCLGRDNVLKLGEKKFDVLMEKLQTPHPHFGREIALQEIERAQELFFQERREKATWPTKEILSQSFVALVEKDAESALKRDAVTVQDERQNWSKQLRKPGFGNFRVKSDAQGI